jgi:uncharacterized membrane protein
MKYTSTRLWPVVGIVLALTGVPFILQMVPPNRWSGFRVGKTLSDERIWYAANRIMGYDLLIVGVVILIAAIAAGSYLRENRRLANRINLSVFILSLAAAVAHSFWSLDRL